VKKNRSELRNQNVFFIFFSINLDFHTIVVSAAPHKSHTGTDSGQPEPHAINFLMGSLNNYFFPYSKGKK
jgi:hypothetical protein